jgi:hypothetical protein
VRRKADVVNEESMEFLGLALFLQQLAVTTEQAAEIAMLATKARESA